MQPMQPWITVVSRNNSVDSVDTARTPMTEDDIDVQLEDAVNCNLYHPRERVKRATGAVPSCFTTITSRIILLRLFLLMAGFLGFTVNLYALIHRYLEEPVLTTYKPEHTAFRWPDITFCNPNNPLLFWKYKNIEKNFDALMQKAHKITGISYQNDTMESLVFAMSSLDPTAYNLSDPETVVHSVTFTTQTASISSSTGYYATLNDVENYASYFHSRVMSVQYPIPCYTFNPDDFIRKNYSQVKSSIDEEHDADIKTIIMDLLMDHRGYKKFNSSFEDRKMYIYLTAPSQTILTHNFHYALPGSAIEIRIAMNHLRRLPSKSKCINKSYTMELYDALLSTYRTFNGGFDDCKYILSQRQFLRECHCYNPFLPIYRSSQVPPKLCTNMSIFSFDEIRRNVACLDAVLDRHTRTNHFRQMVEEKCHRYRRPLCNQVGYQLDYSVIVWSSDLNENRLGYMNKFAKRMINAQSNATDGFIRHNLAELKLFRETNRADLLLEEYEYPLSRFMSDIGGIMGMWLGLSVVALYEFGKMCISLMLRAYHFRC